jgi:CPA1 family monovalent cation:H+ antiporter
MGLQCRFVFEDLGLADGAWLRFALSALVVLLVVLLIRPFWVFLTYGQRVLRRRYLPFRRRRRSPRAYQPLPRPYLLVISWSGMRGVVTLAAAAGVPATTASGAPFPGRSTIQALAFVVAVGSPLIQAPTLPPLVRRLHISADDEQAAEAEAQRLARQLTRSAAEETLRDLLAHPPPGADPVVLGSMRDRIAAAMRARNSADDADAEVELAEHAPAMRATMLTVRREILAAQRRALTRARDAGELDDEVMRRELERLDYEEAAAAAD